MNIKYWIALFICTHATAQVGITTSNPSGASALDISSAFPLTSTFGGLKLPIVTLNQRDTQMTLTTASDGIMVFVVYPTGDRCLEIYDGLQSVWQKIRCTDTSKSLFISEYVEGSGNNKYIELYNPTNNSINLSIYKILIFRNGGNIPIGSQTSDRIIPLTGSIGPGATFIIASDDALLYTGIVNLRVATATLDFNGNDPVALADASNTILDIIGILGTDPGTGYTVDSSTTQSQTIRRIPTVQTANPVWTPSEWRAFGLNNVSGLGNY